MLCVKNNLRLSHYIVVFWLNDALHNVSEVSHVALIQNQLWRKLVKFGFICKRKIGVIKICGIIIILGRCKILIVIVMVPIH